MKTRKLIGALTVAAMATLAFTGCSLNSKNSDPDPTVQTQTYTVTFETNGGTNVKAMEVDANSVISTLPTTSRDGYTFDGWFSDASCTTPFTTSTPVTGNITVYAGWSSKGSAEPDDPADPVVNTYTVTFETNGGTTVSNATVTDGGTVSTLPSTRRDGYTFDGWFSDASCTTPFTTSTPVTSDIIVYAKWSEIQAGDIMTATYGYAEGLYAIFKETDPTSSAIKVEVKKSGASTYTTVANDLVRVQESGSTARVDVVGLSAGTYELKISNSSGASQTKSGITVSSYDRSGYAHFKTTNDGTEINVDDGIGAYKNDGTLKDNAVIVYVSDDTKNTVKATIGGKECIGLVSILQAQQKSSYPLVIRVLDQISAATWKKIDYKNNINVGNTTFTKFASYYYDLDIKNDDGDSLVEYLTEEKISSISQDELIALGYNTLDESKYSVLNGLSSKMSYELKTKKINNVEYTFNDFDSAWNNCSVENAKNVTLEGIGENAELFQWGITFKKSSSIEVRNLTFDDTTEDSCAFEGSDNSTTIAGFKSGHNWIHNNTFNQGANYWDVTYEQDKHEGDGATDIKKTAFITFAYNRYNNCHKTGLVGGGDTQYTASVTFHHNYYNACKARLPFARQANMHMYNNYYSGSTGNNMQIYAGAYAFIEGCYFENINKTFIITESTTGTGTPAVKSYNNIYNSCSNYSGATVVKTRTAAVENGNIYNQNFDTDTTDFYYDAENQVSNVEYLTSAEQAKADCIAYAGAGIMAGSNGTSSAGDNTSTNTETNDTNNTSTDVPGDNTSTDTTENDTVVNTTYALDLSAYTGSTTISTNTTIGDFTIYATSAKTVSVSADGIALGGSGSLTSGYRLIAFYVEAGKTITFTQKASANRTLALVGADRVTYKESATTGSDVTESVTVTVSQIYYLYSTNSGITVKAITVA